MLAFVLVLANVMLVSANSEPTLEAILDELGFTPRTLVEDETFQAGKYEITLYAEYAGYSDINELRWYEVGTSDFNLIFNGPEGPILTKFFLSAEEFGLSMLSYSHTWFTETGLNSDGKQHAKIYVSDADPNLFFIGFENMEGGDFDYNDMVFSLRRLIRISGHKFTNPEDKEPVPEWTISLYMDREGWDLVDEDVTDDDGYYEFFVYPGLYKVSCLGWDEYSETWEELTAISDDLTFDFYGFRMLQISNLEPDDEGLFEFDVVFTPTKNSYKLSSTNPGSFHFDIVRYGDPGTYVEIEILLPPDQENDWYDSPNFILKHNGRKKGMYAFRSTDVRIYKMFDGLKDENIAERFTIVSADNKHVFVSGFMPEDCESILISVHLDFQISGSLTELQVIDFHNFTYTFTVKFHASPVFGVHSVFGVH